MALLTVADEGSEESWRLRPLLATTRPAVATATATSATAVTMAATVPPAPACAAGGPAILVSAICLIGSTRVVTTTSTGSLSPWLGGGITNG